MSFLGVYRALYAYVPQSEQELAIDEDDILYLLEKSEVDDWWTVKKRVVGSDVDEPVGLVPSNYIEPANSIGTATALYDYDRQTEEEVSFKEGDSFQVFDDKDPDWILVSKNGTEFGFVPSNYIETKAGTLVPPAAPIGLPPPPTHPSLSTSTAQAVSEPPIQSERQSSYSGSASRYDDEEEEHEAPPPSLPSKPRPQSEDYSRDSYRGSPPRRSTYDDHNDAPPPKPSRPTDSRRGSHYDDNNDDDEQLYTWSVSEVDGRKKKKAMFAIGNGNIYFSPDSVNGGTPQQWNVKDLLSFSSEKKHIFLEFKNPLYSLEIHTGTKDVAGEILTVLGELKGAVSSTELKEVKAAASSKGKKQGKILYSFEAEGSDELTVKEGETVTIVNNTKSRDWWLVQNKSGNAGVVPAQFVQPIESQSALSSFGSKFKLGRSKSKDNLKESPKKQKEADSKKLSMPKASRIRTWEDRSGSFKVDAEFLGVVDGKIHLHKTNGVKIGVAAQKLSLTDLEYVERVTGMSLESFKGKSKSRSSSSTAEREERERRERKERERKRREREERERDMDEIERSRAKERREREREALERERERKERELERREREMDRDERDRLHRELDEAKRKLKDLDDIKKKLSEAPPARSSRPESEQSSRRVTPSGSKKEDYDWFEFFLEAGVDVNQCQRYSNNFSNEQIDPSILESIDASVLRTLGLREGDIIRVTRYIDEKFGRKPKEVDGSNGGLFSEQGGALKVNRTGSANQVTGSLPSPTKSAPQPSSADDDVWTVKPAANTASTSSKPNGLQTQQFTGSMQDLVNLKPLEPTKTSSSIRSLTYTPTESKSIEPLKTGQVTAQPTGVPLDPFKTGGGNLLPFATGGIVYLPIQQTGLIGVQATGMMPLQRTGGLVPLQKTGGLVPLQKTGGLTGIPTGGLMPLQKTGGLQPLPLQRTGGLPATLTGGLPQAPLGMPSTSFGMSTTSFGIPSTTFGAPAAFPTTSFGQPVLGQRTGGLNPIAGAMTGGLNPMSTGFNGGLNPVATGYGGIPQATFPTQPTGGLPQTSFGAPMATGFGANPTGFHSLSSPPTFNNAAPSFGFNQQMNALANSFQGTSISQPSFQAQQPFNTGFQQQQQQPFNSGFQQQQPFNSGFQQQQPFDTGFQQQQPQFNGIPQPTFGQQPLPQPTFGQQPLPQPTFGQQALPQPTFGQQLAQPLEAQPTGFGFGNSTPSFGGSAKADLNKATPDNPFGF